MYMKNIKYIKIKYVSRNQSYVIKECTDTSGLFFLPFKDISSITTKHPTTSAPHFFRSVVAALIEPPVAMRSSMMRHFSPGRIAFF